MVLTNAERQRRYWHRRKTGESPRRDVTVPKQDQRTRPQRWRAVAEELLALQAQYRDRYAHLPENLEDTALAQKLAAVGALDIAAMVHIERPAGFAGIRPYEEAVQ